MNIGLLLCVYEDYDFISECLQPWVEFRRMNDSSINVKIAVTHGQFKEYHELGFEDKDFKTIELLNILKLKNNIDYLYIQNWDKVFYNVLCPENKIEKIYQNEAELRNHGLKWLLEQDIDYFHTIGADEIYTVQQIINIYKKVEQENLCDYFKIHHRNFVFDKNHYVDDFCPNRIWNNRRHGGIDKFFFDDDIVFKNGIKDRDSACYVIPEKYARISHYTWLSNEKSKNKVKYHEKHFSHGAGCSYKWNDQENKLEFNLDYYKKIGQSPPEIFKDEH